MPCARSASCIRAGMRRLLLLALLIVAMAAGCTPDENEGGTPIPGQASGAPLNDEAVGPSEQQDEADDEDDGQ
jgi:hypothetical protein